MLNHLRNLLDYSDLKKALRNLEQAEKRYEEVKDEITGRIKSGGWGSFDDAYDTLLYTGANLRDKELREAAEANAFLMLEHARKCDSFLLLGRRFSLPPGKGNDHKPGTLVQLALTAFGQTSPDSILMPDKQQKILHLSLGHITTHWAHKENQTVDEMASLIAEIEGRAPSMVTPEMISNIAIDELLLGSGLSFVPEKSEDDDTSSSSWIVMGAAAVRERLKSYQTITDRDNIPPKLDA